MRCASCPGGRPDAHPDADLCDDYRHCAAYRSPAVSVFGTDELSAIRAAVRDTEGEILTSEGAPIAAVFHCVSGPRTESAADVWGEDVPYLQSVVSPGGTAFDGYESAVTVSADDFREKAGSAFPAGRPFRPALRLVQGLGPLGRRAASKP